MSFGPIALIATLVFGYALISARMTDRSISGPLVFVTAGIVFGPGALDLLGGDFGKGGVEILAEATLVLLLFTDATRIDLRVARGQSQIPARLLGIGLPLTVALGCLLGAVVITDLSVIEAALLAAILAPTDAALGHAVVSDRRVPVRIRQALNVESGLNDGLVLPVITILTAAAATNAGIQSVGYWTAFVGAQIGFGVGCGVLCGVVGGKVLHYAVERGWVEGALRQIGTLAIAVGAFASAEVVGGNGFVAAFVAGLAFGYVAQEHCGSAADFAEDEGQLLALLTFLFFGALLVGPRLNHLTGQTALYAILSLTVIRVAPVAISMLGVGLGRPTLAYLGWFGPRGLASILFGLSVVEHAELSGADLILDVVTWTAFVSIVAHGLSARPATARYVRWINARPSADSAAMPEGVPVTEMRTRSQSVEPGARD